MSPVAVDTLSCLPESEVVVLAIGSKNLLRRLRAGCEHIALLVHLRQILLRVKAVAVAIFEESQVWHATVRVAADALQASEEERLSEHAEVLAQGIHQLDTSLRLERLTAVIVRHLSERVVEHFVEAAAHQLFSHDILQFVALVEVTLSSERRTHLRWNLHIIISIYAEHLLYDIARLLHVHPEGRSLHLHLLLVGG